MKKKDRSSTLKLTTKTQEYANKVKVFFQNTKEKIDESPEVKKGIHISKNAVVALLKYVIMYGLCFIIIYPIIQQVLVAFRAPGDINDPSVVWIPKQFSIENFRIAITAMDYTKALWNTMIISFGTTLFQVIITALTGYAFARLKFRGSSILFGIVLLTVIVPPSTLSIPTYLLYKDLGLLGKTSSMFLMSALGMGIKSGIFIFIFRQFFKGIPDELEEAALVDGAGPFRIFTQVMLPNARGTIVTVALFAFVWQWNDSYFTGLFISGANANLPVLSHKLSSIIWGLQNTLFSLGVWDLIGEDITKNPLFVSLILNTAAILVMLPVLVMYLFVQKLFVEGVERSGIVG